MAGVYGLYVELSQRCVIASVCGVLCVCVGRGSASRDSIKQACMKL